MESGHNKHLLSEFNKRNYSYEVFIIKHFSITHKILSFLVTQDGVIIFYAYFFYPCYFLAYSKVLS